MSSCSFANATIEPENEMLPMIAESAIAVLMSGTNAIHGIVIVGAMLVAGLDDKDTLTTVIGLIAVVLASATVVGGFVVTDRMLEMFKKREKKPEP